MIFKGDFFKPGTVTKAFYYRDDSGDSVFCIRQDEAFVKYATTTSKERKECVENLEEEYWKMRKSE